MRQRKVDDNVVLQLLRQGQNQKQIAEHFKVSAVAIHKRLKRILPKPQSLEKLTLKEQKFVVAVAEGKSRTQAVMESFDVSSRASAKAMQNALMEKDDIQIAINELMQIYGLTRGYRINKLKSHIDHCDPGISLKGLDMSFKLDGLYAPEKQVTMDISYADCTAEGARLQAERERLEKELEEIQQDKAKILQRMGKGSPTPSPTDDPTVGEAVSVGDNGQAVGRRGQSRGQGDATEREEGN